MKILSGFISRTKAPSKWTAGRLTSRIRTQRVGSALNCLPGTCAYSGPDRRREHLLQTIELQLGPHQWARTEPEGGSTPPGARLRHQSAREGGASQRRLPTDRRDQQGTLRRRARAHPGRADVGPGAQEVEHLFAALKSLRARGVGLVYISHDWTRSSRSPTGLPSSRMGRGRNGLADGVTPDDLISMMIGRRLITMFPKRDCTIGDEVLRVDGLNRGRRVRNVSFAVRAGEVLGIAGLVAAAEARWSAQFSGQSPRRVGRFSSEPAREDQTHPATR